MNKTTIFYLLSALSLSTIADSSSAYINNEGSLDITVTYHKCFYSRNGSHYCENDEQILVPKKLRVLISLPPFNPEQAAAVNIVRASTTQVETTFHGNCSAHPETNSGAILYATDKMIFCHSGVR